MLTFPGPLSSFEVIAVTTSLSNSTVMFDFSSVVIWESCL